MKEDHMLQFMVPTNASQPQSMKTCAASSRWEKTTSKRAHPVDAEGDGESLSPDLCGVDLRQEEARNRPSTNGKRHYISAWAYVKGKDHLLGTIHIQNDKIWKT